MFDFDSYDGSTVTARLNEYADLKRAMEDYVEVGKEVSEWLLPGRGVFNTNTQPRKRVLVPPKVVNPKAKHAMEALLAFLKDGICPSSRQWFLIKFVDAGLNEFPALKKWAYDVNAIFNHELRKANFYSLVSSYFKEIVGFGTGSMGVFPGNTNTLHFQPLTFGEYAIGTNDEGVVDRLYRTVYMNFYHLLTRFGDGLPDSLLEKFEQRNASLDYWYTVVEGIVPEKFMDMPFTRFYILIAESNSKYESGIRGKLPKKNKYDEFLKVEGLNEFCYPTTRFDVLVAGDEYGVSPGMDAVPVVKRLQEIVKSNSVAYHKSIRPPMNAPVSMKNNVRTYPDGMNYYINPDEILRPAYDTRFDHASAEVSEGKLEKTLGEIFFNDIFLTTSRDPNASPLKARQVDEISGDKYARLGPIVERLFYEGIDPLLTRSFNICDRSGKFPPLPEGFEDFDLETGIDLTSILAQAIKAREAIPMQEFLQMVGAVAQFQPEAMDIPNTDEFLYSYAAIKNIDPILVNARDSVKTIRNNRQKAMLAEKQRAEQAAAQEQGVQQQQVQAQTAKTFSEAGVNLADNLGTEVGML